MYKTLELSPEIKLIITDFDGIFTDNSVYFLDINTKLKKISYKDIMGVSVAVKNGLKVAIVSGEKSKEIDYLAETFALEDIHQGIRNKLPVVKEILEKYNLSKDEVVYIGDDVNDLECLSFVKYPVSVSEANYKVKQLPEIQYTQAPAGSGAFREVVDNLVELKALNV